MVVLVFKKSPYKFKKSYGGYSGTANPCRGPGFTGTLRIIPVRVDINLNLEPMYRWQFQLRNATSAKTFVAYPTAIRAASLR